MPPQFQQKTNDYITREHGKTDGKYFWASWDDPKKLKNQKNLINAYHKQFLKSSSFNFFFKLIKKFIF